MAKADLVPGIAERTVLQYVKLDFIGAWESYAAAPRGDGWR